MNRVLVFWIALLLVFSGATVLVISWRLLNEDAIVVEKIDQRYLETPTDSDQKWMQDFTLTRRNEEPFHSQQLQGKVWVASFFFSACPTVCRTQNERVKLLHSDFVSEDVSFVAITCDPENDSPATLASYASQFTDDRENWFFLTGNFDYIRRIAAEKFQMALGLKTHKEHFSIVDKWGNVRGAYHWNNPEEWLAMRRQIKHLVDETQEPAEWVERRQKQQESMAQLQENGTAEEPRPPAAGIDPSAPSSVPEAP